MYVETERRKGKTYHYLVENVRSNGGWKKIKIYLGCGLNQKQLEEAASKHRKLLKSRVEAFMRASDPLFAAITPTEERKLADAKKAYASVMSRIGKRELEDYHRGFVVTFTYNTNAIEGSTLSLLDTKFLLEEGLAPEGKSMREISEARNHKDTFNYMLSYEGPITRQFVLKLHKLLMHDILWKQAGRFRDVHVRLVGVDKTLPSPSLVPARFKELMLWHARNKRKYHPVVVAAFFHHAFESVHPFRDGNGRVGRLLMNYMLKKAGYPMIDIKYADRRRYYDALQSGDSGDFRPLAMLLMERVFDEAELIAGLSHLRRKAPSASA